MCEGGRTERREDRKEGGVHWLSLSDLQELLPIHQFTGGTIGIGGSLLTI